MKIVFDLVDSLSLENLEKLIPELIESFSNHSDPECQRIYLEVLKIAYKRLTNHEKKRAVKVALLRGLMNKNEIDSIVNLFLSQLQTDDCDKIMLKVMRYSYF